MKHDIYIFSPNTPLRFTRIMRRPLGVSSKPKLGTYLGCPMEVDGRSTTQFNAILSKVVDKITSWKFINLSQAGKLILINTILTSLASHILSIYILPAKISRQLSSTLLKFWWSSSSDKKPIYWRSRDVLEQHKSNGGLSFRNIQITNKALIFNQAWRIHNSKESLVYQVFKAKYKKDPIQLVMDNEKPKKPSYAFNSLYKACSSFKSGLYKKIGNGKSINLFQDRWSASADLKPRIMNHHQDNDHPNMVADLIDDSRNWKASKVWQVFPPDKAKIILALHIPHCDTEDTIEWSHTKSGKFSVKSGYWFLKASGENPNPSNPFWRMLWKSNIFPKWKHFIWKIMVNVLPTADNLVKRNIQITSSNCKLCKERQEGTTSTEKTICVGCEAPICVGLRCDAKGLDANDPELICVVCGNDADG